MKNLHVSTLIVAGTLNSCSTSSSLNTTHFPTENNKKIARSYIEEVVNQRKLELIKEIFSPDYISHQMDGSVIQNIKDNSLISFLQYLFKAFPDLHYTIDSIIAEGDKVALNLSATGTHQNEFLGIAASGNRINYKEMFFFRLTNGKIVEGWVVVDVDGVKEQMKK